MKGPITRLDLMGFAVVGEAHHEVNEVNEEGTTISDWIFRIRIQSHQIYGMNEDGTTISDWMYRIRI
jgi:hypothetical protein